MLIIDEPIIQDFKEYSFCIKANLRDYEYNEEVIKDIKKLKNIFHIMIMEYSCRRIVDKNIVDELVYFPYLVYDCRYNIKEKKKEIENIAYEFFKLREKILDNTYEFVMNEKEENYCEEQYTKMLELEIECWKTSLGQTGFISVYEKTKKFDIYSSDIFLKKLKEIIEISKKINIFTKNIVRIICNVYDFFYKLNQKPDSLGEIERVYLEFIDTAFS